MFGKNAVKPAKKLPPAAAPAPVPAETQMFVPTRAAMRGHLELDNDFWLEGRQEGNVASLSGSILTGAHSSLDGNISGFDVTIGGHAAGSITAAGQFSALSGADIAGDISAASVLIEEGASYSGFIRSGPQAAQAVPEKTEG